jgi:hypothetical protein
MIGNIYEVAGLRPSLYDVISVGRNGKARGLDLSNYGTVDVIGG